MSDSCNPSSHMLPYLLYHLFLSYFISYYLSEWEEKVVKWHWQVHSIEQHQQPWNLGASRDCSGVQPIIKRHNLQCNVPNCSSICNHKCKDNFQTSETTTQCSTNKCCLLHKYNHFLCAITLGWPSSTLSNPPKNSGIGQTPPPPLFWQCQDF